MRYLFFQVMIAGLIKEQFCLQYSESEMAEIFSDIDRAALDARQVVTRHEQGRVTSIVDMTLAARTLLGN